MLVMREYSQKRGIKMNFWQHLIQGMVPVAIIVTIRIYTFKEYQEPTKFVRRHPAVAYFIVTILCCLIFHVYVTLVRTGVF